MKTCLDCSAEIAPKQQRCPPCRARHAAEYEANRKAKAREANRERLFFRPCQWDGCTDTVNSMSNRALYCPRHRRENGLVLSRIYNAEKRGKKPPKAPKVRYSPETKRAPKEPKPRAKSARIEKEYSPRRQGGGIAIVERPMPDVERRIAIIARVDTLRAQGNHAAALALHCANFATPYREAPTPARIGTGNKPG